MTAPELELAPPGLLFLCALRVFVVNTFVMQPDFDFRLRSVAEVIVRVGVNLQPGQSLLITDPYELQGVHPESAPLVDAIRLATSLRCHLGSEAWAKEAHPAIEVIPADPLRLRELAETDNIRGYEALVSTHTRRLQRHLSTGGAFLFLLGSQPQLMSGLPAERINRFSRSKWRQLGPLIQRLVRGATQWTLAPAPTSAWADTVYADLPLAVRLPALWRTVFEALRVTPAVGVALRRDFESPSRDKPAPTPDPVAAWQTHLASLARRRDELRTARHRKIRYVGPGTDLTLALPRSHQWCTAQLTSKGGIPFVANLPTEEIFTAPHKSSANGSVKVSRPVAQGGAIIEGLELEFVRGRVVRASARTGQEALEQLLATDPGACRIGEVALVPGLKEGRSPTDPSPSGVGPSTWQTSGRLFRHPLLDENAGHHIALGDSYRFCSDALLPLALNSSQIHLDLPLDAEVTFPG